jgi:Ca2+-binding EF-hand superfamily protein
MLDKQEVLEEEETVSKEYADEIFDRIDKNHDNQITAAELILALREDATLGSYLCLPEHIRQEDGTREVFEEVF